MNATSLGAGPWSGLSQVWEAPECSRARRGAVRRVAKSGATASVPLREREPAGPRDRLSQAVGACGVPPTPGRMARSAFAGLLEKHEDDGAVITLPAAAQATSGPLSARQRAAIKWAT